MKKTRRFVALLLAAVLALALFTACGAAEQPQSAIGKVYEDWFVEQINSKRPADKPVQKVDVKHSEMRTALAKISEDGKFTAGDGRDHEANGCGFGESWYWMILSDRDASADKTVDAVVLTPENLTQYGPAYFVDKKQLYRIDEYDIVTSVMDDKTYVAVYLHLEEAKS
ncbi:hypothetical protein CGS55_04280 [Faecalibacterium prausnitzii]|uniref:Lipoprotein n=1 Tax=Faecalibacterium prausnitzii TaxID=853 RepID=A0A2A6ZU01_9FIRM|nr:hypothetical protein [Faecalibacterium prausnitzii]PDX73232.1 hypothetical protein CGS55_04280 [Faecalibacterium prausnitzii]PLK28609.1 hypothetical protein CGS50_012455 [Faecalibacterium prausnitzii]